MNLKDQIKLEARKLGFDFCGFSKAEFLEKEARQLDHWLSKNYHGEMSWMENHYDLRLDPRKLVPGAKSVISLMLNYYPDKKLPEGKEDLKISKYAYGEDYHKVIRKKLKALLQRIKELNGDIQGRVFVDSAPVMDKVWAAKSGIGWIGKNSNLINKDGGSFFFLGEIISDLEIEADGPIKDYCGTCTACIDQCPTDAIVSPYVVDGSKCISYYTIELKNAIPQEAKGKMENWIFGCDICQDVCPWNRFSKPTSVKEFFLNESFTRFSDRDWVEITEEVFEKVFKDSPIKRSTYSGFKRNISFVKQLYEE